MMGVAEGGHLHGPLLIFAGGLAEVERVLGHLHYGEILLWH